MAKRDFHTPDLLRQILRYEPESGRMYWRHRSTELFADEAQGRAWNARTANKEAFTSVANSGYKQGKILGVVYLAHRVAWAMAHGVWPTGEIDHVNGNRTDNRASNLRQASRAENCRNAGISVRNSSGLKGVSWDSQTGKWRAQIRTGSSSTSLGRFSTPEEAHAAYCAAAQKHHGEFAKTQ